MASTRPRTYSPQAHTLARKNIKPILPPNSGPRDRLIMSGHGVSRSLQQMGLARTRATQEEKKPYKNTYFAHQVVEDTVGSAPLYGSVGGNGADGEYGEWYDGVGHGQHEETLKQPCVTHHESCETEKPGRWLNISRLQAESELCLFFPLTCSQEENDAEHGEDGRHHHPKESVESPGVFALRTGFRWGLRRGLLFGAAQCRGHG